MAGTKPTQDLGRRLARGLLVLSLVSVGMLAWGAGNEPGITIQFVARGLEPKPGQLVSGDHHDPSPSHVFMIVKLPTAQGIKEEAYGFYPAEGSHGIIKGPGMLKSEFRCGRNDDCDPSHNNELKRLSESEVSVTVPVTLEERQKVLRDVVKWNDKDFQLNTQNCIDFVDSVAKDLGYPTPTRSLAQLPIDYLKQLKPLVDQEQTRRAQAAQQREAPQKEEIINPTSRSLCGTGAGASQIFCGPPTACRYRVDVTDVRLCTSLDQNGAVIAANLSATMKEALLGPCPYSPYPANAQSYSGNGAITGTSIKLTLSPSLANKPQCSASFTGTLVGGRLRGTLTIQRNDAAPILNWQTRHQVQ